MSYASRESDMPTRSYRWLLFALAVFGLAADQASKYRVFNWLYQEGEPAAQYDLIPGVFKLFVQYDMEAPACDCPLVKANAPRPPWVNHGALWSLGGEFKTDANKFFATISILAAAGITIWGTRKKTGHDRWLCAALGLILGGTLGNLFDRIVFGGVRDFLCFYWFKFPIFNIADSCLVCGASLLLLQALFAKKPAEPTTPAQPTT
jgi:lipoprotein signal peptidase